jgi:putative transposase
MARLPRLAVAGQVHLVQLLGHNGQAVFADDADRADYLAMLREAAHALGVAVHAYSLLDEQVWLLVTPREAGDIGRLMQALGRRYVNHFNRRHGRSGTLWNGRFRSAVMQAETWLVPATVYIECLVLPGSSPAQAVEGPWSSAQHHLGRQISALITEHPVYWKLGNTPFERELVHANLLKESVSVAHAEAIDRALRSAHVLGDAQFCAELARQLGRATGRRPRGRPPQAGRAKASD